MLAPCLGSDTSPSSTTVTIPAQSIRVGFFMNNKFSLEPAFGLTSASGGGTNSTSYRLELGGLWHFSDSQQGLYVRPFVGFRGGDHFSDDGGSGRCDAGALRCRRGLEVSAQPPCVSAL